MIGFRKFFIFVLICCQWLAFGGISIYYHFCTKADLVSQRFFIAPQCHKASCDLNSCCKKSNSYNKKTTAKSGCCRSESSFLKLFTDLSQDTQKPALFIPAFTQPASYCYTVSLPALPQGKYSITHLLFFDDLPPPETGAHKVIRLRKILC